MPIPLSLNVRNCVDFINLFFISVAKIQQINGTSKYIHKIHTKTNQIPNTSKHFSNFFLFCSIEGAEVPPMYLRCTSRLPRGYLAVTLRLPL